MDIVYTKYGSNTMDYFAVHIAKLAVISYNEFGTRNTKGGIS